MGTVSFPVSLLRLSLFHFPLFDSLSLSPGDRFRPGETKKIHATDTADRVHVIPMPRSI